jgi:hypothetical protein
MELASAGLLAVWERGQRAPALQRALLLLELALPGRSAEELAETSLSGCDRALTRLRQSLFGNALGSYVDCPACGERLSVDITLPSPASGSEGGEFVSREGLRFRAPNSRDLTAIADAESAEQAVRGLLQRCCTSASAAIPSDWSDALIAEAEAGLAALDPDAELYLDFSCASCGHAWQSMFDPAAFLWEEIEAHAIGLLHTVHRLAAAYGWSERDILAMPAPRRAAYLQLLGRP